MPLRRVALAVAVIAGLAVWLGQRPGRWRVADESDCIWGDLNPVPHLQIRPLWVFAARCVDTRVSPPACETNIVSELQAAVDGEVSVVLAIVALGALLVAVFPRRTLAGAWIVATMVATVIAFVLTRSFEIRWQETIALWPRHATWALAGLTAGLMMSVLIWLLATEQTPVPTARTRP